MNEPKSELWSDLDGTIVELHSIFNPINWSKYPSAMLPGYLEFIHGVTSRNIIFSGILSRRYNTYVRRLATSMSISKHGISQVMGTNGQTLHKGSDDKKGETLAWRSLGNTVAMLEDKPQLLARSLIRNLVSIGEGHSTHPVIIGVAPSDHQEERIEAFINQARKGVDDIIVTRSSGHGNLNTTNLSTPSESIDVTLTPIPFYSRVSGVRFGQTILNIAG